jgi:hypothetical protein
MTASWALPRDMITKAPDFLCTPHLDLRTGRGCRGQEAYPPACTYLVRRCGSQHPRTGAVTFQGLHTWTFPVALSEKQKQKFNKGRRCEEQDSSQSPTGSDPSNPSQPPLLSPLPTQKCPAVGGGGREGETLSVGGGV